MKLLIYLSGPWGTLNIAMFNLQIYWTEIKFVFINYYKINEKKLSLFRENI